MKNYITTSIAAILLLGDSFTAAAREKIPEAEPVGVQIQHIQPAETVDAIAFLADSYGAVPYEKFIEAVVEAIEKASDMKAIASAILPIIQKCENIVAVDMIVDVCQKIDQTKSTQFLVELSKRLDKTTFIDIIVALIRKSEYIDPVKLLEWYQAIPFDSGTGLWAIGQKAKKYAEDGNAKRVAEMLELYNKILKEYKEK